MYVYVIIDFFSRNSFTFPVSSCAEFGGDFEKEVGVEIELEPGGEVDFEQL